MERVKAKILHELAVSKKTIWELLEKINCTLKDFVAALKELNEKGLLAADENGFYLTERCKSEVNPKSLDFGVELSHMPWQALYSRGKIQGNSRRV